jgi:hypothetical protein
LFPDDSNDQAFTWDTDAPRLGLRGESVRTTIGSK